MRIRTYDEVDPYGVLHLTSVAFGWHMPPERVRVLRRMDPRYLEEYAYYAVERGRPVAQAVPMRMPVRLTTGVEVVGGVQAVCSHPARWGRGNVRRLMDRLHERFRELDFRISTLTTSRNIRGHSVYAGLGYTDLAPFYRGTRRVPRAGTPLEGVGLRRAVRADFPAIQRLFEAYVKDSVGWTVRWPQVLPAMAATHPRFLGRYRIVVRGSRPVGYLRTLPEDDVLMEEVIAPRMDDFRGAVALMERKAVGRFATTTWITARKDHVRFRELGYEVAGPIADTTMALSLDPRLRTGDLPRLFGGTTGRFAHYPTEDF